MSGRSREDPRRRRDAGPRLLGAALGEVRERLAPPDLLGEVQARWRAVAGEQVAEEAWPDLERTGTVTVRCRSAVWAASSARFKVHRGARTRAPARFLA
jgi:predicted nucleic acid-binding Zn ribbon protein